MKGSSIISHALVVVMMLAAPTLARNVETAAGSSWGHSLDKALNHMPVNVAITINNYLIFVDRNSESPLVSGAGIAADYPKGTGGMIFKEGLVWGARVRDGQEPIIRVNGSTYATGLKAGRVLYDGSGKVIYTPVDTSLHVWRVRPDYAAADLKADYASSNSVSLTGVTDANEDSIRAQYTRDWANWPADEGAPYDDVDGNGAYDPLIDIPGWPGADQTLWLVANDIPYLNDDGDTIEVSPLSYGSPAIGIELQITMWGYAFAADHPLGNAVFKRARVIYTGLPGGPSDARLDSVYFSQWSDPDLGVFTDDYVGCDIDLSFGYVYNGSATDGIFLGDFGLPVPAGGYDFLQGPIVDGDTLGMTSFGYFGAGSSISDPTLGSYEGTNEWWNLMEGFLPQPPYPEQVPWTDPTTGEITIYPLSGDPVSGTGWIDGIILPPGDRRMLLTAGPFTMALGDTQDVVLASVAGLGQDNISSITVAKFHDSFAQFAYDIDFDLPSAPSPPKVEAKGLDGEIVLNWGHDKAAIKATETEVSQGFVFEGYNVYQLPSEGAPKELWVKVATYDLINLIQTIFDPGVDPGSGFILEQVKQSGSNSGVQRYFEAVRDEVRDRPITNDNPLFFAVTAYSYLADNVGKPFKTLESGPALVSVIPQQEDAGTDLSQGHGDLITTSHDAGTSTARVEAQVVDPGSVVDASWGVYFSYYDIATQAHLESVTAADTLADGSPSYRWGWNLTKDGNDDMSPGFHNRAHPDFTYAEGDITSDAPILDGVQIVIYNPPFTAVSDWDFDGNRWISGFSGLGGPALFGGLDLGANVFGSDAGGADYAPVEMVFQDQADVDANGYVGKGAVYHRSNAYGYAGVGELPFTVWTIDGDGNRVRQLNVSYVEDADEGVANLIWDMGWDGSAFADLGGREYIFIHSTDYQDDGLFYGDPNAGALDGLFNDVLYFIWPVARGSRANLLAEFTLQIYPAVAAIAADTFSWSTTAADMDVAISQADIDMINVFPNPYYGFHPLENKRADKWVKFNHLPVDVTIRIFTLGGVMVRVLNKSDGTQYLEWDLKNQGGFPVASGIYIAQVDAYKLNMTKILKLAIVQEEQILRRY